MVRLPLPGVPGLDRLPGGGRIRKTYFLVLFVLALPVWIGKHLDFHPSPYGISTFGFPIHVSLLPLTALYVIWAVRQVVGEDPAPLSTRGLLPLAGVFAAAAISVLGSTDKLFAAFDLFALGTSILIFIYAASEIRQRRELRLVLGLLIFSAAFQGAIALAQYLTGSTLGLDFFGADQEVIRLCGPGSCLPGGRTHRPPQQPGLVL